MPVVLASKKLTKYDQVRLALRVWDSQTFSEGNVLPSERSTGPGCACPAKGSGSFTYAKPVVAWNVRLYLPGAPGSRWALADWSVTSVSTPSDS